MTTKNGMEFGFQPSGCIGKWATIDRTQIRVRVRRFLLVRLFLILGLVSGRRGLACPESLSLSLELEKSGSSLVHSPVHLFT
mmetsp:Transcript_28345/g.85468  ORF Transcript_28345/g.85468 Transcript_28345/m.85468 type:complete len:82 (-) Transcript_28345:455-700(-)